MKITENIKESISLAFSSLFENELNPEQISLQPTRKEFEGNWTFVCFPYARISKKKPEETAQLIGEELLKNNKFISSYNVVKGFLNLSIHDKAWLEIFSVISQNKNYGNADKKNKTVIVEYSSPNTNKPLHLGHLRNNFLGSSVSKILDADGYNVKKVNLVNDRGIHICKSMIAYELFGENETPESSNIKGDHLVGKYYVKFDQEYKKEIQELVEKGVEQKQAEKEAPLLTAAQTMLKKWEEGDQQVIALWKKMNAWVYDGFNKTYQTMGVEFDQYYYESYTYLLGKDIVNEGLEKGVFFKKENQSVWANLESEGLDEKLVLRADGTSVYITQDLGTADLKYKDFHFDESIYVVGDEQNYHFNALFKILNKLERPYAKGMHHLSYGMVDLPSGKMKSREGTVVDADELMQEMFDTAESHTKELGKIDGFSESEATELYKTLGLGALKYFLLKVDPKKRMLFNPEESIQFQGNTGPFIQYTHARISAILRKAKQLDIPEFEIEKADFNLNKTEVEALYTLQEFPNRIHEAAKDYAPSVIAQYAFDLAKEYNRFYTEVPIFAEEDQTILAFRIAFSKAVANAIKKSMNLLGIHVPERM